MRLLMILLLWLSSNVPFPAFADNLQPLGGSTGVLLQAMCSLPDSSVATEKDVLRCKYYLEGMINGLAYQAREHGVCLFAIPGYEKTEDIRKKLVAWFLLNNSVEVQDTPSAAILQNLLVSQYPCR